jgi:hypothetical protein
MSQLRRVKKGMILSGLQRRYRRRIRWEKLGIFKPMTEDTREIAAPAACKAKRKRVPRHG